MLTRTILNRPGTPKRSMTRGLGLAVLLVLTGLMLTGCVPGDGKASPGDPAGFLWGIWHGWVSPVSLVLGIFNKSIRVYEKFNTGWWYDFGFYMAIISGFGGLSLSRRARSVRHEEPRR